VALSSADLAACTPELNGCELYRSSGGDELPIDIEETFVVDKESCWAIDEWESMEDETSCEEELSCSPDFS